MNIRDFYTKDEVVKLAKELVKIPSHKNVVGREAEVAKFLHEYCIKNGLDAKLVEVEGKRCNVEVLLKGTGCGKTLILNGHIDTVPPYNMTIEPFAAEEKDGYIWGRGINDMKGAIASMVTAMLAIKRSKIHLKGDILLVAAVGEEEKSDGTEAFVLSGKNGDGAIVGEPSDYGYALGHRGLEWLEIVIEGKSSHGGTPELGVNAISKAADLIKRIETKLIPKLDERTDPFMGKSIMNFGKIEGGDQPSTVAGSCIIQIDRRYLPIESVESVIAEYQDIIDELSQKDPTFLAKIHRMENNLMEKYNHAPLIAEPDSDIAKVCKKVLGDFIGKEPEIATKRGWTDAGVLSTYGKIPTVVMGPGKLEYSHTKDEKTPIEDLYNFVEIYSKVAMDFCG